MCRMEKLFFRWPMPTFSRTSAVSPEPAVRCELVPASGFREEVANQSIEVGGMEIEHGGRFNDLPVRIAKPCFNDRLLRRIDLVMIRRALSEISRLLFRHGLRQVLGPN